MYALEFRAASRNHIWIRCAICETKAPLERVRQGQPDMTRWRVLRLPGTVQAACTKWRSVPLMRYGQNPHNDLKGAFTNMKYCNPDTCSECLYIGEGDSICEISHELVLDNWQSVPHTIPQECPFLQQITHQHRKVVRRR